MHVVKTGMHAQCVRQDKSLGVSSIEISGFSALQKELQLHIWFVGQLCDGSHSMTSSH